jgi:hypothetical protein
MATKLGARAPALLTLGEYYKSRGDTLNARIAFQQAADLGDERGTAALTAMANVGAVESAPNVEQSVVASIAPVEPDPPLSTDDPPSVLAGRQLSLEEVMRVAYSAGFTTEDQLLPAVAVAIAESQLFSAARNWQPQKGYRPASDEIGVLGPLDAWAGNRQMHSDRGIWQIASKPWSNYPDSATDDPRKAAAAAFLLSRGGFDFSIWDSFRAGRAQKHYDQAFAGWPALRPLIRSFLSSSEVSGAGERAPGAG